MLGLAPDPNSRLAAYPFRASVSFLKKMALESQGTAVMLQELQRTAPVGGDYLQNLNWPLD